MSVKVMTAVFERFPEGGGIMLLALALADHAHDDGTHIYPSVDTLAGKTRQSDRSVQRQLKLMVDVGWLIPTSDTKGGRGLTNEYKISPEWLAGGEISFEKKGDILSQGKKGDIHDRKGDICDVKGDIHDRKGDTAMSPEPSRTIKNHKEPKTKASASALNVSDLIALGVNEQAAKDFLVVRKAKRAPLTQTALDAIAREAEKANLTLDAAIRLAAERGWQGFSADWLMAKVQTTQPTPKVNQLPKNYGQSGRL
jgi:hypothetical protein